MMSIRRLEALALIAITAGACSGQAPSKDTDDWVSLFNGKDLDGWTVACKPKDRPRAKDFWRADGGTLMADTGGRKDHDYVWLVSRKEYADFELRFKVQGYRDSSGNSGVQVRSRYDEKAGWMDGPQVDLHPRGPWRCGFIYDETRTVKKWLWPDVGGPANAKPEHAPKGWTWKYHDEGDGWNDVRIVCRGTSIRTFVNGVAVADYDGAGRLDDADHGKLKVGMKGHIALQIHGRNALRIRFKEIRLKPL